MDRIIGVQQIPPTVRSVADLPSELSPLRFGPEELMEVLTELDPSVTYSDSEWALIELRGGDIEVIVPDESPLRSFTLLIHADDPTEVYPFIACLLGKLGVGALDPDGSPTTGLFNSSSQPAT